MKKKFQSRRSSKEFISAVLFLSLLVSCLVSSAATLPPHSQVIEDFPSAPSILNVFSTPITFFGGAIYTVRVESPSKIPTGVNLKTVISKGTLSNSGQWTWRSKVLEDRTIDDMWHTQPSLQVDKKGYIHVAYNMHNMPWQYVISEKPENIGKFNFKGEKIENEVIKRVKEKNSTPFPKLGSAAIPGAQITYPAFFKDRKGDLYVTYRFATKPKRSWSERAFAGGLAKYDVESWKWYPIGGAMPLTKEDADLGGRSPSEAFVYPFAFSNGWTVYLIRLSFDRGNGMHAVWVWREGGAGPDCSYPSYAYSPDHKNFYKADRRTKYKLPIHIEDADTCSHDLSLGKVYAPLSIAIDPLRQPVMFISCYKSSRVAIYYNYSKNRWDFIGKTPFAATQIFIDDQGIKWAFASGLKVLRQDEGESGWRVIYDDEGYGYPKVTVVPQEKGFLVQTYSIDGGTKTRIYWIKDAELNFSVEELFYRRTKS
ncbi:MAG: BNR-4 repeat-containing protein [Deltaproteobacteria bacterium]|nr:BNR-4 repeat-containing protein [Deltaproteobacteria bacterium]